MSKAAPTTIGPYRVLRLLGQGGMGTVYLVEDAQAGARRALKVLGPGADPDTRRRFRREAEAMARVDDHPAVLRIHSAGEHEGLPYLVMAHAPGGDLGARLKDGPLPPAEVVRLGVALARGLEHVHSRGVLHRDLKPSNVLFDEAGEPRLVDFGLARVAGAERLTQTGTILGTPAYMAPEQANARPDLDARVDVYGLGALLYHALTGRPPFQGATTWAVLDRVLRTPPTPPSELVPGVPPALEAVILRALAKSADERFPSAAALADALEAADRSAPRQASARRTAAVAVATLALLAASVAGARASRGPRSPPPERPAAPTAPDLERERSRALALLRSERPREVLDGAAEPWGPDDPRADVIAAAARLCDAEAPAAWRSVVAQVGAAPAPRTTQDLELLTRDLVVILDGADLIAGAIPSLERAVEIAERLGAARRAAGDDAHPQVVAAAIRAQRSIATRITQLVALTAAVGAAGAKDRARRQELVIDLLHTLAALEPASLSADALRIAACAPAIVTHVERDATWAFLDAQVNSDRLADLHTRYPDAARSLPALWMCAAGPLRLADEWDEADRRWADLRRAAPTAFGEAGQLVSGVEGWWMQQLIDAARARSVAAVWRAWSVRADGAALAQALDDGLEAADVVAQVDPAARSLDRARLRLLVGDGPDAGRELTELGLERQDGAVRNLGERLLLEVHLLNGDLLEARRLLEAIAARHPAALRDDPTYWRHHALVAALEGRHEEALATLDQKAAPLERPVVERDLVTYCPWWKVDLTRRMVEAARDRGWSPSRARRLFLAEQ